MYRIAERSKTLKRILLVLFFFLISSHLASAALLIDAMGAYTTTGDAKSQIGGGFALGYTVNRNFSILCRSIIGSTTKDAGTELEINYAYRMFMGAVEYNFYLPGLPIIWKSSAGLGGAETDIEFHSDKLTGAHGSEFGAAFAVWTGIQYVATQHVSPFIDFGYHKAFYFDKLQDAKIGGIQILLGVRVILFGNNKSLSEDY